MEERRRYEIIEEPTMTTLNFNSTNNLNHALVSIHFLGLMLIETIKDRDESKIQNAIIADLAHLIIDQADRGLEIVVK